MSLRRAIIAALLWSSTAMASASSIDAPELAQRGPHGVGYRSINLVQPDQADILNPSPSQNRVSRPLTIDLWYPAEAQKGRKAVTYRTQLWGEPPLPPIAFTHKGNAVAKARPKGQGHPLVILSHGYSNAPALMSWLTEALASKGYVVAGIRHNDPNPYLAPPHIRAAPFYLRPMDIRFAANELRTLLGNQIDPERIALIGYSQGGYGVLTAGGASLDPSHPIMEQVAGGALRQVARGSGGASGFYVPGVKAIIAMAPATGGNPSIWGQGLAEVKAPLLLISGDADPVVGYEQAARRVFDDAKASDRYLLTFKQAGHAIALISAPEAMRGALWDLDWFEDPIWRQDRVSAINLHFITAFLGLHLRGDATMRAYLDVPVENAEAGLWDAPAGTPWGAYSPGGSGVTLWKGFQRRHAQGLRLEHRTAD